MTCRKPSPVWSMKVNRRKHFCFGRCFAFARWNLRRMNRLFGIALFVSFITRATVINAQPGVTTQHNDHDRSGWYHNEKILNTNNVRVGSFARLFSRPVDDQIYSQPLVVLNVPIAGGSKNVVYVKKFKNSVYA
jgi:hypothetical protein